MALAPTFVIVGGGLAGAKAAEALRSEGFPGPITLVSDEMHRPYLRPPLSKDYLQGKADGESLFVHPPGWYRDHDVEVLPGCAATALDRRTRHVLLADDSRVHYDKLLLATGSSPRLLEIPGPVEQVLYLRRLEDCERIKEAFGRSFRAVIIGAGWIGLETAAAARAAGLDVTVLESAELPLVRILGVQVAQVFADQHRDQGVDLRCGVTVDSLVSHNGALSGVRLGDGTTIPADMVIAGVGITPNVGLAASAELEVDNGVVVDEHLQTSDPDIYAAGDVANAYNRHLGRHIRVEHWANAVHQPVIAAMGMMGRTAIYERLPFFYSDQYDLGLEYTGYCGPHDYDRVVFRGDVERRQFIAFWLARGRVLAGMNVNVWDVADAIGALIESKRVVDLDQLADPDVPLAEV